MTSEEMLATDAWPMNCKNEAAIAFWLREIALQLAVMNEREAAKPQIIFTTGAAAGIGAASAQPEQNR